MTKLNIKLLASKGTPTAVLENGSRRIERMVSPEQYQLSENNPDVLFFLTGGSELSAIQHVSTDRFYILIGSRHDNSFAAATEVKSYLNGIKVPSILFDEEDPQITTVLNDFYFVNRALKNLKEKKLGLIGQVSNWLISSSIDSALMESKLGIRFVQIPWSSLDHFSNFKVSDHFLETFSKKNDFDLTETAKVYDLLAHTIQSQMLDAFTVECFPMVIQDKVTACLPLAKFNNDGIPAGCEGDLTAIVGMMLCKELTGTIPWIANINKVSKDVCMFSHCTIAPALVSEYSIKTHFESGEGTALEGHFKEDLATIFRFDQKLEKAFITSAQITGRPKSEAACRTQIEAKLSESDVKCLKQNPLGNHHLIFPGDCTSQIRLACMFLGMEVIN